MADSVRALAGTDEKLTITEMQETLTSLAAGEIIGGGSQSINTCTVTISIDEALVSIYDTRIEIFGYTAFTADAGVHSVCSQTGFSSYYNITFNDVVCGSCLAIRVDITPDTLTRCTNGAEIRLSYADTIWIEAPTTPNTTGTVYIYFSPGASTEPTSL